MNHEIHYRAFLTDKLTEQDYLTMKAEQLTALLTDTQTRLAQNADIIAYMETIIRRKPDEKKND